MAPMIRGSNDPDCGYPKVYIDYLSDSSGYPADYKELKKKIR